MTGWPCKLSCCAAYQDRNHREIKSENSLRAQFLVPRNFSTNKALTATPAAQQYASTDTDETSIQDPLSQSSSNQGPTSLGLQEEDTGDTLEAASTSVDADQCLPYEMERR